MNGLVERTEPLATCQDNRRNGASDAGKKPCDAS
jgi:hypothetical protein